MNTRLFIIALTMVLFVSATICPSSGNETQDAALDPEFDTILEVAAGAMYDYRNYAQIKADLMSIELAHPDIVDIHDIGDSWEKTQGIADRDILAVKISDNVAIDEDEPEVMIVGLHHAREWSTSELVLAIVRNLTSEYGNDSRLSWLVDNREIWIVPVVNPDGLDYSLSDDQWWRKNRRNNLDGTYGVDLNRNYNGSQNGDSEGEWGGAGTSSDTSSDIYCGSAPFSEPETQAIRDMVYQRDFEIALDFHSYGNWVMWPWSYTANLTEDNADLVRIGTELAAINGYTPAQSVDMYATTGDSLDWLYGGEDIYAILFEVGDEFNPPRTVDVEEILQDNVPAALYGIEIAGDREAREFDIVHSVEAVRSYSASGFKINATITAGRGVDTTALSVFYRVGGGSWSSVAMSKSLGNDTYTGIVPSQLVGSDVEYYIVAQDLGGIELMSPAYAPYDVHTFTVSPSSDSEVEMIWDPPATIDGSVANTIYATAHNLSTGAVLVFYMLNGTLYYTTNGEPVVGSPDNYSIEIAQGLPLGLYELWLTSEVGGVPEYESAKRMMEVRDETPPEIWGQEAIQTAPDQLQVTASCSDLYGVTRVTLVCDVLGDLSYYEMAPTGGTATNGTWTAVIPITGNDVVEYRFVAYQEDLTYSELPVADWFVFTPIPEFGLAMVVVAMIAVVLVSAAVSRARRA